MNTIPAGDRTLGHAVVLGGGFAGILAAGALAPYAETVTVLDRDEPHVAPQRRRGVPQDRHPHFLGPGGAELIEALLPGVHTALWAAGARRIRTTEDMLLYLSAGGWLPRYRTERFGVACSRSLLDHVLRERVRQFGNVGFRGGCLPTGLLGDARAVTGVTYRDLRDHEGRTPGARGPAETCSLPADLVVDATGRASRASALLAGLGVGEAPLQVVDAGHSYSSRVYRARPGAERSTPLVLIQAETGPGRPSGNGALLPIEDGLWIVTLGGLRGAAVPDSEDDYLGYARHALGTPLLADMLADAEPVTAVLRSRSTFNRRHRFDRVPGWPRGFLVLGDAATALNPVYGQGLTVAARGATALRATLAAGEPVTRRLQRAVARSALLAWEVSTRQDRRFPHTIGPAVGRIDRLAHGYADRVMRAAQSRPAVGARLIDAMFLAAPAVRSVGHPMVALAAALDGGAPHLTTPPLTDRERSVLTGGRR
ncbi:NAD(P)/FAD-dependent oxidoreductase [Nocardia shimofusensis]|uniref:NAD(P)/FAD-dependent oxidoreductase n=1 Tax=Nocardia shimofusensis TaxID=228596 RepID=UPI000832001A|nr:hypothetical protein [Nocardia shimofusensis]